MKLRISAAELIAAQDIIDVKDNVCLIIIRIVCQDDQYAIVATNGYALAEFTSKHISDDFDCGQCFFKPSSVKKFLKAADRFVDIYFDGIAGIRLTAISKSGDVRDSVVIDCVASSLFPIDDSVDKVFLSGAKPAPEVAHMNASCLCKVIKGIERAYGKNTSMTICVSGERPPLQCNASYIESHGLDITRKSFRGTLVPLNVEH